MFEYRLKLLVPEKNSDEFIESLRPVSRSIRKENGCLDFILYRDLEKRDAYSVIGKWKTRQAMNTHFAAKLFSVLIGAAKVLGRDFEMSTSGSLEQGGYPLAKEKIALHPSRGKTKA